MKKKELREKVITIIMEHLDISVGDARMGKDETTFDELGADSLDMIELLMVAEEEFYIEIPDALAEKMTTIGKAVNQIAVLLHKRHDEEEDDE